MTAGCRAHGRPPYRVAVLHGGPGAPGSAGDLAESLSEAGLGVLEPLQSAASVEGQVEELREQVTGQALPPVALVGHSWGAFLGYLLAARHPRLVSKLVLVGAPPFEEPYSASILPTRLSRLAPPELAEAEALLRALASQAGPSPADLARLGEILEHADAFDPLPAKPAGLPPQPEIFRRLWDEASQLRQSGGLLAAGRRIPCPVLAVHGEHDPHPAEGVKKPLAKVVLDFRFVLLEKCGHAPWRERQARETFLALLQRELGLAEPGRSG